MSHHLLIGKAGGAMVQEAMAAGCPMIINQVIPGQEEGNARLIEELGVGAVASKKKDVTELVADAFANGCREWKKWRTNLQRLSRPDSALRIAELVLGECAQTRDSALRGVFNSGSHATSKSRNIQRAVTRL